jgi:N-acetylneuraminic acid mutarotase
MSHSITRQYALLSAFMFGLGMLPGPSPAQDIGRPLSSNAAEKNEGKPAKELKLRWTLEPSVSTWRYEVAAATAPDGEIYVIGGASVNGVTTTVDVFSTHGNKWNSGPPLPHPRYRLAAATGGDGRIYAIGGSDAQYLGIFASVVALTPGASQWVPVAPMPTARQLPAAATGIDGRIYVVGGANIVSLTVINVVNVVEIYTPSANQWVAGAPMPTARYDAAVAAADDGRIFAIGGFSGSAILDVVEVYSPATNSWTTAAPVPRPLRGLAKAVTGPDGRIYLIGGCEVGIRPGSPTDCGDSKRVDVYTPWTNSWETGEPTIAVHREGAVAVSGKRIYALSGHTTAVESAK